MFFLLLCSSSYIAMGTHSRLGLESWMQRLAGEHDALRAISKSTRTFPRRWCYFTGARPPAKELLDLRRHHRAEHAEVLSESMRMLKRTSDDMTM